MPKISIVLPVYNAEKYLRETLDSVLAQTYTDFELLAIDDGSKDDSRAVLHEYEKKDARVCVTEKANSGVSDTRNVGIAKARGEYIAFLDADDLYSPEYLSVMINVAEEKDADVVVCEYETFRGNATSIYRRNNATNVQLTDVQKLLDGGLMTSMWVKIFRRDLLQNNDIRLDTKMTYGEDLFFCWKACLAGKRIYYVDETLYGYRLSGEGATSKYHDRLYEKYQAAFADLKKFCAANGLDTQSNIQQMNLHFAKRLPSLALMCARSKMCTAAKREYIVKILQDEDIRQVLSDRFEMLTEGSSPKTQRLYEDARKGNADGVLRFGKSRKLYEKLAGLKSRLNQRKRRKGK